MCYCCRVCVTLRNRKQYPRQHAPAYTCASSTTKKAGSLYCTTRQNTGRQSNNLGQGHSTKELDHSAQGGHWTNPKWCARKALAHTSPIRKLLAAASKCWAVANKGVLLLQKARHATHSQRRTHRHKQSPKTDWRLRFWSLQNTTKKALSRNCNASRAKTPGGSRNSLDGKVGT